MGDDFFVLFYQLEGQMGVAFNDTEFRVNPNEFYFYDSRNNHQLIFQSSFNHIAIRVPRPKVRARWQELSQLGSFHFPGLEDAMSSLVGANVKALAQMSEALSESQIELAVDNVLELFSANVQEQVLGVKRLGTTLLDRATDHIDRNISFDDLNADHVAAALGVSRRYLDRLFQKNETTVGHYIRSARLKQCANELRIGKGNGSSIAEIAYAWGFQNAAHFSKVFRAEFGMSPSEYRASKIVISSNKSAGRERY